MCNFYIAHCGELILKSFFIHAVEIPFSKQAAWTTMLELAEVV